MNTSTQSAAPHGTYNHFHVNSTAVTKRAWLALALALGVGANAMAATTAQKQPPASAAASVAKPGAAPTHRAGCSKGVQTITWNGSGNQTHPRVVCDQVVLRLNGPGTLTVKQLRTQLLVIEAAGRGRVVVQGGRAQEILVNLDDRANVSTTGLQVDTATANVLGKGNIRLGRVGSFLEAVVQGQGTISYQGTPDVLRTVSGKGAVVPVR